MKAWRLALLVPLLAACGGGGASGSYAGTAGNSAVYVTWKRSDKALTGQLTRASVPGGTEQVEFTGTANGSSVTLLLAHALGARTTLSGALVGDTLTLDYPGEGDVSTIRLRPADRAAFERATASLRTRVARATPTPPPAATVDPGSPEALMKAVRAAAAAVRSDESFNYTDTICDDVSALTAAVKALRAADGVPRASLAEAKALEAKAEAACRRANGGR